MKQHTTNYLNTFIQVAEDCPNDHGVVPPLRGNKKSIANYLFELLSESPYKYTSDEVLFKVHAIRKDISESEWEAEWQQFFSKGQPCFRASPLTKKYGWGVHHDADGKVAIYGRETEAYQEFVANNTLKKVNAMRSKRK